MQAVNFLLSEHSSIYSRVRRVVGIRSVDAPMSTHGGALSECGGTKLAQRTHWPVICFLLVHISLNLSTNQRSMEQLINKINTVLGVGGSDESTRCSVNTMSAICIYAYGGLFVISISNYEDEGTPFIVP
jgi:hypothetical protein